MRWRFCNWNWPRFVLLELSGEVKGKVCWSRVFLTTTELVKECCDHLVPHLRRGHSPVTLPVLRPQSELEGVQVGNVQVGTVQVGTVQVGAGHHGLQEDMMALAAPTFFLLSLIDTLSEILYVLP